MKAVSYALRGMIPLALLIATGCKPIPQDKATDGKDSGGKGASAVEASEIEVSLPKTDYAAALSDEEKAVQVATLDGETITMGDLYGAIGSELFRHYTDSANKEQQIRRAGLEGLIEERLLEKEAKARSITVDKLVETEITSKIKKPSDADLQMFFEQNKRRMPPNATFEQMKPKIEEVFMSRESAQAREGFLNSLKEKAQVVVTLPFPNMPVANVTFDDDPVKGNKDAPVKLVEFSDFQCPYCERNVAVLKKVAETYGDKVAISFRDFPLEFHDKAMGAALAANCAFEQDKYWEFHDHLFANQNALEEADLIKAAETLGLDKAKFTTCLKSKKGVAEIKKDMAEAQAAGVTGTPATFVNGKMVNGAQPFESYKSLIDGELARLGLK